MKIKISAAVLFLTLMLSGLNADAQCPMCKTALESNQKGEKVITEKKFGRGINNGILYLLAVPYLAAGAVGYFWWKKQRSNG